jgi:hypothetical protein
MNINRKTLPQQKGKGENPGILLHRSFYLDVHRWSLEVAMVDLRKLMAGFTAEACAIAGQVPPECTWEIKGVFSRI